MNKTELIAAVAEKAELSKKDAEAAVTAAISLLPSWLTISVSIRPREKVIRFCRAIGPVTRSRYP